MIVRRAAIFLAALAVLAAFGAPARAQAFDLKEQDGISAELRVVEAGAVVRWRFLRPIAQPIDSITATVSGRPLGVPAVQPYPGPGEESRILALLDVTGSGRDDAVTRHAASMLVMLETQAAHQKLAIGVFGEEMRFIIPERGAADIAAGLAGAVIEEKTANLADVIASGVAAIATQPGQRRALYLFTDGASAGPLPEAELAAAARGQGVALTFILDRSARGADIAALRRLSEATGGEVVEPDDLVPFLRAPFARIDTGATIVFPLGDARTYPWESAPAVAAEIRYGERTLALSVPAPMLPKATWSESADYAWRTWPTPIMAGGGVAVLGLAGLGAALGLRRSRASAPVPGAPGPTPVPQPPALLATLTDEAGGQVHEIRSQLVQLGRDAANDVPLSDLTVSRRHALILKTDAGFLLRNEDSRNGVFVNEEPVQEAVLADGDVVGLGSCRLRFRLAESGAAAEAQAAPATGEDGVTA